MRESLKTRPHPSGCGLVFTKNREIQQKLCRLLQLLSKSAIIIFRKEENRSSEGKEAIDEAGK